MPDVSEDDVYDALLKTCEGKTEFTLRRTHIVFSLSPMDIHNSDSPDFILWVDVSMKIFGQDLNLRIPLPVEAEKGGIYGGALEDLQKYIEREHYKIELPMLVVSESGYENKEEKAKISTRIQITQVPIRALDWE